MDDKELGRELLLVVNFQTRSTDQERTARIKRLHVRYSTILDDVTVNMGQQTWSEEELGSLEMVTGFKRLLVETFHEHFDSDTCTAKYHLRDPKVVAVRRLGAVSNPNRGIYDRFMVHNKQGFTVAPQRKRGFMVESVHVTDGNYEMALQYEKKMIDGKRNWKDMKKCGGWREYAGSRT